MNAEESANEAWAKLVQHYQASRLKERLRLAIDFYMMKMEPGEHPRKFLLRVDQMVKELERVNRPVDPINIDIVILSGPTPQYDAEVRMLESSSDWPTREWIERAVIDQYERPECDKSAAGSKAMLSTRGHRCNDKPPIRCPLCSRTGHSALQCRKFQTTHREKKPNRCQGDREHGGNGRGGRNGGGSGNGRGGESGGLGGNRGGGGSKSRGGGGNKPKKSSMNFESGEKTACPDCYLEPCKASEGPNHSSSVTAPTTPNSQHGGFWGSVRTNLGAGLLVATSARPALTARGAPRERHGDGYWVADSGATEYMTQDSSHLEDYTPPLPGDGVESAGGVFLPVAAYGCLRLLVDQDNGTFKGATRELTPDRVAHVPKLGRHNLLSTTRLTTAFDASMCVYPAAATIRPRFDRKTLVFFSLREETGLLEIKARRRTDMEEPLTPLTTARSMVAARANPRHIMEFHRLLGHPSEEIARGTVRMSGVPLTGTWRPCV